LEKSLETKMGGNQSPSMERSQSSRLEENLEANLGSSEEGSMERSSSEFLMTSIDLDWNKHVSSLGPSMEEDLEAEVG
jgi:preprotein translocase subunit SecA